MKWQYKCYCNSCDKFIKFLVQVKEPRFSFGKYVGKTVGEVNILDVNYLNWVIDNNIIKAGSIKKKIMNIINEKP